MHAVCKVPFCHTQYNKKAVFLEFYCLLSIYFWGRVFDNLGGAGEQIKILGHLFTPVPVSYGRGIVNMGALATIAPTFFENIILTLGFVPKSFVGEKM